MAHGRCSECGRAGGLEGSGPQAPPQGLSLSCSGFSLQPSETPICLLTRTSRRPDPHGMQPQASDPQAWRGGVSGTGQFSWSPQFTLGGGCHPSLEARSPLSTQPAGPSLSCPWFSLLGSMGYRTPGLWRCSKKAVGTGWDPCSPHVFRQRPCGPKQCDPELSPAHSGVVRPVQDGLGAVTRLR